jgi:hypothetical protein
MKRMRRDHVPGVNAIYHLYTRAAPTAGSSTVVLACRWAE